MKKCNDCQKRKPMAAFGPLLVSRDKLNYICKKCGAARSRGWYRANRDLARASNKNWRQHHPEQVRENNRRGKYPYRYGITEAEKYQRLRDQRDRCAICRTKNPGKNGWHTDHPHKGKKRCRGILCQSCNHGLGFFRDSSRLLRAAARYLAADKRKQKQTSYTD